MVRLSEYVFEQDAFCSTSYKLPKGTLIGTGYFDFNAKTFTVSVTGGTGKYVGARVTCTPTRR